MKTYEFAMTPAVHAGVGAIQQLSQLTGMRGITRPLIITDRNLAKTMLPQLVTEQLSNAMLYDQVTPDPTDRDITDAVQKIRDSQTDGLIALGGGSSIDVAKLASLLAHHDVALEDLALDWSKAPTQGLPLIAIPTTVGSGSEMTRGAVFIDSAQELKRVVIADSMAARDVVLDPELLRSLPPTVVASTGADALTQAIEGVLSTQATPFTNALHLQAIRMMQWALPRAFQNPSDSDAMGAMQEAAAMVGAGLARSGVGAAHAIANVLGGHYPVPHGVACAMMLLPVLEFNAVEAAPSFDVISEALAGPSDITGVLRVLAMVRRTLDAIEIHARLRDFGVLQEALPKLAKEAAEHSDMTSNPRAATSNDVLRLLEKSW